MARRKFRDVAVIGGLIFQGYPGEYKKTRHLQSSAGLLFNVFTEYDPHNLLLRQAYHEVMEQQMEEVRLRNMLERIAKSKIILRFPEKLTPFCFPLKVDSMREDLSSEKLEDRVKKMQQQLSQDLAKKAGQIKYLCLPMQKPVSHKILDQQFWLTTERTMFWEDEKSLIVSDLHFGKTGHFRKSGIAVPAVGIQRRFATPDRTDPVFSTQGTDHRRGYVSQPREQRAGFIFEMAF